LKPSVQLKHGRLPVGEEVELSEGIVHSMEMNERIAPTFLVKEGEVVFKPVSRGGKEKTSRRYKERPVIENWNHKGSREGN